MKMVLSFIFIAGSFLGNAQNKGAIRDIASIVIDSCTNPLFIVDGIRKTELRINPDNIKSMEVVKSDIARALYGESGRNGAIIVTTKRRLIKKPNE